MPFVPDALDFEGALKAEGVTGRLADLARSVYQQESRSGADARTSYAGAVGPMQVIPDTFTRFADKGWNIADSGHNTRAGLRYLKHLDSLAKGDPRLTAAGYYGGEGAIDAAQRGVAFPDPRNPDAPNTLQYADQVVGRLPASTGRFVPDATPAAPAPPAAAPAAPAAPTPAPRKSNIVDELILSVFGDKLAKAPDLRGTTGARVVTGLSDLQVGATQRAAELLGLADKANPAIEEVRQLAPPIKPEAKKPNAVDEWILDKAGGMLGKLPDLRSAPGLAPVINTASDLNKAGETFDWARLAGNMMNPLPYKMARAVSPAATLLGRVGQGAGAGAALGWLNPVDSTEGTPTWEKAGKNALLGGTIGGVLPVVGRGVEFLADAVRGRLPSIKAGHILRDAAGDTLPAIRQANAAAPPQVTAAQAAAPVARDEFLAAGNAAERIQPTQYRQIQDAQEAARKAALRLVQPNQASAEAARTANTQPLYKAAEQAGDVVDTTPILRKVDDLLARQPGNPELVRELTKVRNGLVDSASNIGLGPTLSRSNAEKVMSTLDGLKAAKANKENKYILGKLIDLQNDIRNAVPGLQKAEQEFATRSAPVNQAKVIDTMLEVLQKPGGGERAGPLLNVLGKGEDALIRKATGAPRYQNGDLNKVMTPQQMSVIDDVAGQLTRDLNMSQRAAAAGPAFSKIVKDHTINYELPNLLNPKFTVYNRIVRALTGSLDEKTMQQVAAGMRSGKSANELMDQLPADARKAVVDALVKAKLPGAQNAPETARNALIYGAQESNR